MADVFVFIPYNDGVVRLAVPDASTGVPCVIVTTICSPVAIRADVMFSSNLSVGLYDPVKIVSPAEVMVTVKFPEIGNESIST